MRLEIACRRHWMVGANDTIAAIATAQGRGAVGIVRISGPEALSVATSIVGDGLEGRPREMLLRVARDDSGERIDEVLAVLFVGPHSFTGEDVVELHGHGGVRSVQQILGASLAAGARAAEAGEFTRRAFENGKLDLTQAEGLLAVIEAGTERAQRMAQQLLAGELRASFSSLRDQVTAMLASAEAEIDFPEDVGPADRSAGLAAIEAELSRLEQSGNLGRVLSDGISVALVGETNAGKSSLFNRLVGRERSLVAEEAGTTRDFVESAVIWDGVSVTLVDTAGERTASGIESRGIELGRERAAAGRRGAANCFPADSSAWPGALPSSSCRCEQVRSGWALRSRSPRVLSQPARFGAMVWLSSKAPSSSAPSVWIRLLRDKC